MNMPIIIKLLASLAAIIILNRMLKRLPLALLGGTLLFAFWIGLSPSSVLDVGIRRLLNLNTAGLAALVTLVILLSMQMKETHMVQQLVSSIRSAFSPRASLAVIPAVIGLLPMPGGALFSAPLLDNFDDLDGINPRTKTSINYWFRHVWEYAWPLYPGVILAADIADIQIWQVFVFGLPMSVLAFLLGFIFFLRKIGESHKGTTALHRFSITPFLPVVTVIVVYAAIQFLFPILGEFNQYLPMVIGLLSAIGVLQLIKPLQLSLWVKMAGSKQLMKMLIIILMVRLYGGFIEAEVNGISVVQVMAEEMRQFGLPSLPLILVIPFLTGMTMGVSLGFAGAALPIVMALLGPAPAFGLTISTLVFAYVSGFMGTMLSPLHVCMIVTSEYYKTDLARSYRPIMVPALLMIILAFIYMQILQFFL
jgi:integral membrane protein (TIGR00529 family)